MTSELRTADFDFVLPPERIAQTAVEPRDHARLLHVGPGGLADRHVYDLPDLLKAGDLLVINDTKVIPARLYGDRGQVRVEILLHLRCGPSEWMCFARPGKRLKTGDMILFANNFSAEVLGKNEDGQIHLRFNVGDDDLLAMLEQYGEPPLPPYIQRDPGQAREDRERYQTIYAAKEGAVAAPTAGLHFTPQLLQKLAERGIETAKVTLHVGAGTFLPVKAERIADHKMHAEWGEIIPETAQRINRARQEGRRIVAVGTTSLRVLESAADEQGMVQVFSQNTSIFIYPGYRFKAVDALMTNFHLPQSTLFMLVAAFAGLEPMREAYTYAIAQGYRFYSYGDASLLEKGVA